MEPILKYPGAKWRLAEWIIQHMPPHESYLEPFFGSGAVFFNKPKSRLETINDIDGTVVQFFRTCREQPEELARAIALTPWARKEYQMCDFTDSDTGINDVECARRLAVRCWMTFGARTRCKTGWRHSVGKTDNGGPANPKLWNRLPDTVMQVATRLKDAQIESRDAVDVIREYNGARVLIYADPPYLKQTRTLLGDQYRHEMDDEAHARLLTTLQEHRGMVLLSGYDSDFYRSQLSGWAQVRKCTTAERGIRREESLWLNPHTISLLKQQGTEVGTQLQLSDWSAPDCCAKTRVSKCRLSA